MDSLLQTFRARAGAIALLSLCLCVMLAVLPESTRSTIYMPHHETSQAAKTQLSSGRQIEGSTALFSGLISGRGLNWTYAEKKRDANEVTNSLCSDSTLKKNGADFFQVAMARVTLNLIVEFDIRPKDQGGVAYEYDWIRHLVLGGINRPIKTWIVPHGPTPRLNNSLLVFLFGPRGGGTFFKEMRKEGYTNLGAYHMGNEHFNNDVSYYKDVEYVFHNYYSAELQKKEPLSMFIPLGQKMGFGHVNPTTLLPPNQRKNVCCFMGSLRANRQEMLDVFTNANIPCLISKDKQWGDPSQLATVEYRRNLLDSTFALAPWGNNPESMRLYEALEAGAIPISQNYSTIDADKDFIHHGLPGWPCPVVNNWAEAPALVEAYLSNETALLNLQADMVSWWTSFKGTLQQDVKLKIDRAFLDHK